MFQLNKTIVSEEILEKEFNIKFLLEEALEIKNVSDFKKQLEKHGVNVNG